MTCKNCGKELKLVGELTSEEKANWEYSITKFRTVNTAADREIVNFKEMTPDQVYAYYKAVFDIRAEASFLETTNLLRIAERLGVENFQDLYIDDGKAYIH